MNTIKNTSMYINCFNFPVLYKKAEATDAG